MYYQTPHTLFDLSSIFIVFFISWNQTLYVIYALFLTRVRSRVFCFHLSRFLTYFSIYHLVYTLICTITNHNCIFLSTLHAFEISLQVSFEFE